jgi:hypothetical protein
MALSNQSDLPAFFSLPESKFKNSYQFQLAGIAIPRKMALGCWFHTSHFLEI